MITRPLVELAGAPRLVDRAGACGGGESEYHVAIPPEDADKTQLCSEGTFARCEPSTPNIHPVTEIRFTSEA